MRRTLQANDYYEKGCKIEGVWVGSACEALGVKAGGSVVPEAFERLRQNQHASLLDPDGEPIQITERMHGDTWTAMSAGILRFHDLRAEDVLRGRGNRGTEGGAGTGIG